MQQILSEKHHISGNHYIALRIMKDPQKTKGIFDYISRWVLQALDLE